ncbi:thiamine pyrophosphate-binding protein [Cohnella boryungensis]|uniref:Thiamine pyrophosphate-binding protein n=1 Tax=Cohnella boryungensis TaxID=768479 RepID=A0ABV8SGL4_9BACL
MPQMSVSEAILEQLLRCGVERIYGVVGDAIFGLMDAIAKRGTIRFISVKHESVAALMASAEAKCTGKLAVCAAQMGPGLANLLNGLGDAYLDGYPVLAITGQAPLNRIGTPYKQFVNQQSLLQAISGYTQLVVHPDSVIPSMKSAIHASITRGTVSHISIPMDLFNMQTQFQPQEPIRSFNSLPDPNCFENAGQILRSAMNPMILVGDKGRSAKAEIERLALAWGSGVANAYGSIGVIADDFALAVGGLGEGGNPYLASRFKEADVVLSIGTSWWPDNQTPLEARVIQIACRQNQISTNMPADGVVVGDIATIVAQLNRALKGFEPNSAWIERIRDCKQTWKDRNESEGNGADMPMHPSCIVRKIENHVSPDAIIALDEGDSTLWFMRNFRAKRQRVLVSEQWRTMGFGLPAAMAAKLCYPQRQVICLTGDGGLGMVLADLLTASRYGLAIVMIVLNNGCLQMERNKMGEMGIAPEGTAITNPDYVKLAEACGWKGYRTQSPEDFDEYMQALLTSAQPVLIEVPTTQAVYPDYPIML